MRGVRYFLRDFSASAVEEHLRSQVESAGGAPDLTGHEVDLVRFIIESPFDWAALLAERPGA